MEFETALRQRVSTRHYNDRIPAEEDVLKVVDSVLLGPIVKRHQLHISVVTNRDVMAAAEKAADEFNHAETPRTYLYGAPVWIVISGKKYTEDSPERNLIWNNNLYWNMGSLVQNMQLQATDLGLASCAINTVIVAMKDRPDVRASIGIPEGYDALASVVLGYTDEETPIRDADPGKIPVSFVR